MFDAYLDHAEMAYRHGFRGCGLLNAAAELPADAPGRLMVRQHKEQVEELLAAHLAEVRGLTTASVRELAEELSYLLEGAMTRAGLEGHSERLHRVRALALTLVNATARREPR